MRSLAFESISLTCDADGSSSLRRDHGVGGRLPALPSHTIDMDQVEPDTALDPHGKIHAIQGSGTLSVAEPGTRTPIEVRHFVLSDGARITLTRVS